MARKRRSRHSLTIITSKDLDVLLPSALVYGENRDVFRQFCEEVYSAIDPRDLIEKLLCLDAAQSTWDLARFRKFTAEMISQCGMKRHKQIQRHTAGDDSADAELFNKSFESLPAETQQECIVSGLAANIDKIERVDQIVGRLEARRNAALREIDRRRTLVSVIDLKPVAASNK
jgi:hypothetical protein